MPFEECKICQYFDCCIGKKIKDCEREEKLILNRHAFWEKERLIKKKAL